MFVSLLVAIGLSAPPISTQADMHARVITLYDFHPSKLDAAGRAAKSNEMDRFWNDVKAAPASTLPLLRIELRSPTAPAFFEFDGSELLLALSKEPADKEIVAAAIVHADLQDTNHGAYFGIVHQLAVSGVNVTDAALHMLDFKGFAVPVPQHAMTLHLSEMLPMTLGLIDQNLWFATAKSRFDQADVDGMRALLALFFYQQTDEGDAFLCNVASSSSLPKEVSGDAKEYLKDEQQAKTLKADVKGTEAEVRERRRLRMAAVSDEALGEAQEMTIRLAQLRHP